MFKKAMPFFIKVITPLHAGIGQELGVVDLPIQRERHTGLPKIESSGVKGSIREAFKEDKPHEKEKIKVAFGPEEGGDAAATLGFTEARLLLFPIKSAKGIFALATSPMVLRRFKKEFYLIMGKDELPQVPQANTVTRKSRILLPYEDKKTVILEEFSFEVEEKEETNKWAKWLEENAKVEDAKEKLVILPDDQFQTLVNLSTEVITRIRINQEKGTVEPHHLFTEEFLPSETVLYSFALATPLTFDEAKKVFGEPSKMPAEILKFFREIPRVIQMGGDATIGKGIVEIVLYGGKENGEESK